MRSAESILIATIVVLFASAEAVQAEPRAIVYEGEHTAENVRLVGARPDGYQCGFCLLSTTDFDWLIELAHIVRSYDPAAFGQCDDLAMAIERVEFTSSETIKVTYGTPSLCISQASLLQRLQTCDVENEQINCSVSDLPSGDDGRSELTFPTGRDIGTMYSLVLGPCRDGSGCEVVSLRPTDVSARSSTPTELEISCAAHPRFCDHRFRVFSFGFLNGFGEQDAIAARKRGHAATAVTAPTGSAAPASGSDAVAD